LTSVNTIISLFYYNDIAGYYYIRRLYMKSLVSKLTAIALGFAVSATAVSAESALEKVMKARGLS